MNTVKTCTHIKPVTIFMICICGVLLKTDIFVNAQSQRSIIRIIFILSMMSPFVWNEKKNDFALISVFVSVTNDSLTIQNCTS